MKKHDYTVQFVTPAFLGNAEQNAQWRAPPFKTMLRQLWRILKAKECNFDSTVLQKKEAAVFGGATDSEGTKSSVRLKLSKWSAGTKTVWDSNDPVVLHPNVTRPVGSQLYLGYGPLKSNNGTTSLKNNAAIQEGDKAEFSLIIPEDSERDFSAVMQLANYFATVGGRSRHGWGSASFTVRGIENSSDKIVESLDLEKYSANLEECLKYDWPTALGSDDKGLLFWTSKALQNSWGDAMLEIATVKIAFRTQFNFIGGMGGPLEQRHILSYPVTHHGTRSFYRNARLPNQLRFKVYKTNEAKYKTVAFHFPVKTPDVVGRSASVPEQIDTWKQVHKKMDELMLRSKP